MPYTNTAKIVVFAIITAVLFIGTPALAQIEAESVENTTTTTTDTQVILTPQAQTPTVVRTWTVRPARKVNKTRRFTPWAKATPSQIHKLIRMEARRWGAPAGRLTCRINGESTFRWYAQNGQYTGLGQFAPSTFYRGMSGLPSRVFTYQKRTVYPKTIWTYQKMSDGTTVREKAGRIRQIRITTYRGVIPAHPPVHHSAAQVRIMALAMVGRGRVNDSEWEVRC